MKHILSRGAHAIFESEDIGFMKLATKYRDDILGLIDSITANTAGFEKSEILNPSMEDVDPKKQAGTPENKAAVNTIMAPVKTKVLALIDRMALDNKMSQGQVILSLYDKLDSGLMTAITTIAKPFTKDAGMVDQGVVDAITRILSEDPKLSAIPLPSKPGKPIPVGTDGKPVTVNGGGLIGSVIDTIITKLGLVRLN